MDPTESTRLIEAAGGATKFADLLGLTGETRLQRVTNWKRRGIPYKVILENQAALKKLRARHNA